jgi:hypothetical protein
VALVVAQVSFPIPENPQFLPALSMDDHTTPRSTSTPRPVAGLLALNAALAPR